MEKIELTEREKTILRHVIQQFILTASPVGSRNLARHYGLGYSPATVRNIMSDLEEIGLLGHPHTSAGRVPTDLGYRVYVDNLMDPPQLTAAEKQAIKTRIKQQDVETEDLLKLTSLILSDITNQLACVTFPKFENAILEKIQIVQVSSSRILVVLTINSGLVRTITLEIRGSIEQKSIAKVQSLLNEKLAGLKFSEIRQTFSERIKGYDKEEFKPVIRVFLDSVDKIFTDVRVNDKTVVTGIKNIVKHPEFVDMQNFQSVIELVEDKDVIIHLFDKSSSSEKDLSIHIGIENEESKFADYSLITKKYSAGETGGTLGVVGPKRMEYSKIAAAVMYITELLSQELKEQGT